MIDNPNLTHLSKHKLIEISPLSNAMPTAFDDVISFGEIVNAIAEKTSSIISSYNSIIAFLNEEGIPDNFTEILDNYVIGINEELTSLQDSIIILNNKVAIMEVKLTSNESKIDTISFNYGQTAQALDTFVLSTRNELNQIQSRITELTETIKNARHPAALLPFANTSGGGIGDISREEFDEFKFITNETISVILNRIGVIENSIPSLDNINTKLGQIDQMINAINAQATRHSDDITNLQLNVQTLTSGYGRLASISLCGRSEVLNMNLSNAVPNWSIPFDTVLYNITSYIGGFTPTEVLDTHFSRNVFRILVGDNINYVLCHLCVMDSPYEEEYEGETHSSSRSYIVSLIKETPQPIGQPIKRIIDSQIFNTVDRLDFNSTRITSFVEVAQNDMIYAEITQIAFIPNENVYINMGASTLNGISTMQRNTRLTIVKMS